MATISALDQKRRGSLARFGDDAEADQVTEAMCLQKFENGAIIAA